MKTLTTENVQEILLEDLQKLRDNLLLRGLDCLDDQAVRLLYKYHSIEEEIVDFMYPDKECRS